MQARDLGVDTLSDLGLRVMTKFQRERDVAPHRTTRAGALPAGRPWRRRVRPVPRRWCRARRSAHGRALTASSPAIARSNDVLPLPDGPMTATNSPSAMSRSTAWRAVAPPMPTDAWSRTTAATAVSRVPCVPRMYSAHSPRAPNLPRRSRRIGVLPRPRARSARAAHLDGRGHATTSRRRQPAEHRAPARSCRVPETSVGQISATTTSPARLGGSPQAGGERPDLDALREPPAEPFDHRDAEQALAPHRARTEQLPRREGSTTAAAQDRLHEPPLGRMAAPTRSGLVVVRQCSTCGLGGQPQNGPGPSPTAALHVGRDLESVVAVAFVVDDRVDEERPHGLPRPAASSRARAPSRPGSRARSRRRSVSSSRRPPRRSTSAGPNAVGPGGRVLPRRSMPSRRRSPIQIESAPTFGCELALQSTTTIRSNTCVAIDRSCAQARTLVTAAKCSAAATTVSRCHTS